MRGNMNNTLDKQPDMQFLAKFIPSQELAVLKDNLKGDERAFFIEMLNELEDRIRKMPSDRSDLTMESPVLLHYFFAGCDWWLAALDQEEMIGFGYAMLNGNWDFAEMGDVWLPEIFDLRIGPFRPELDLYWNTEKTLQDIHDLIEKNRKA